MSRDAFYSPGTQVPGTVYKVLRLLAQGGMGFVYDVEDVSVGKRYVLKTLTPELLGRRDLARRMEAEARVLARLSHPNIVDVITAGTTQDDQRMPYFVMERLNGQSLRTVLDKKGVLDLVLSCRIGIDVLDALEHAHDNGVVHRDVKPDNVFLHRTAVGATVTKLLDFGVMRLVDSNLDDTRGRFVGTLRYAAPEQVLAKEVGPPADLYATALVLYEMVAGRGPFEEIDESVHLANAHVNEAAPPLSRFVAVPEPFERLVMGALSKDADGRPRDAFTFAAELRKILKLAQRSVHSGATAVAPLSGLGNPGLAAGSSQAESTADDPLASLGPAAQDGLQAYAKTLAGVDRAAALGVPPSPGAPGGAPGVPPSPGAPGVPPSTVREGLAAASTQQPAQFASTLRISEKPAPLPAGPRVDRHSPTKSFVADPLPRTPYVDTLKVDPGVFPANAPLDIVFPEERPAATTTGVMMDEQAAHAAPAPSRRAGLVVAAVASVLTLGSAAAVGVHYARKPETQRVASAEQPAALTASVVPAAAAPPPAVAAPVPSAAPVASASAAPEVAAAKPAAHPRPKPEPAKSTEKPAEKPKKPEPKPAGAKRPGMDF